MKSISSKEEKNVMFRRSDKTAYLKEFAVILWIMFYFYAIVHFLDKLMNSELVSKKYCKVENIFTGVEDTGL